MKIPKGNIKIVERGKIDTPDTHLHDRILSWLGTGTSIKGRRIDKNVDIKFSAHDVFLE